MYSWRKRHLFSQIVEKDSIITRFSFWYVPFHHLGQWVRDAALNLPTTMVISGDLLPTFGTICCNEVTDIANYFFWHTLLFRLHESKRFIVLALLIHKSEKISKFGCK